MRRWPRVLLGAANVAFAAALLGCALAPRHGELLRMRPVEPPPVGFSVEGRVVRCRAYGDGPAVVLIVGGIHGDEPASAALAERLCGWLGSDPAACDGRQVVVVPGLNPDGLAANRRTNASGVDLNRNFATANWRDGRQSGPAPMSEPETQFLAGLIRRYEPAAIVQIHQPLSCVDWDGPARELAEAMAGACGLRLRKLGAQPGSLGSYAGVDRQIPTVTLELPRAASGLSPDALWARYGQVLLVAIRAPSPATRAERYPKVEVGGNVRLRWERSRSR